MATWSKVITEQDDANYKNSNVSGVLVDNANDTTSGVITAAGFTTTGTWTFDEYSSGTIGITTVQDGATSFNDNDTSLLTAGAIADYVTSQISSGDITSVSFSVVDSVANTTTLVSDVDDVADFVLTNTGGITLSGNQSSDTITIGVSNQLDDIHGMTEGQTTALATIPENTFDVLGGQGSNNLTRLSMGSTGGFIVEDSIGQTSGNIKSVTPASAVSALQAETWTFAENVTMTGNLTVNGTTTTVSSTTVEIADKLIVLANGSNSAANATGAGIEIDTDNSTKQPTLQWSNDTGFPLAIMSSGTASASGNGGGVGSFYYETDAKELFIRTD